MKFAYLNNGVVVEVVTVDPFTIFNADYASDFVEVPDEVQAGWLTTEGGYEAPPSVTTSGPIYEWYIDIGPFFDRFGAFKLPVLASTDATVQAIIKDVQVRKWVDLKRVDVQQGLAFLGSKVAGFTTSIQNDILTAPVTHDENLALRRLYF